MALVKQNSAFPEEMIDAYYLHETGWSPDILDTQPVGRVRAYLLYKQIKAVLENGGELKL